MSQRYTRGGYALPATSMNFHTGSWRVDRPAHRYQAAPCHAACPAGEDAQAYLAALEGGDPEAAWSILVAANPLPAITGRVCHHPCESACNRGRFDEAIAIHGVERYLGDEAIARGWDYAIGRPGAAAKPVAVVGAGPAGLSAAYHLTARGYRVTLFEANSEAGGLLRSAIPPYRLPRKVLDAELERLLALDFETRLRHRLGRDVSLDELQADHRAVFIAPGTQQPKAWDVAGATPGDLTSGIEILREWVDVGQAPAARRVAVVGGGNTAMDLARALRLNGAEEVHVVTHQSLPGNGAANEQTMSAIPREIHQAQEEGVTIHEQRGVRRLILRGERVVGVELVRMKSLDRGEGRWERVAFEGTETVLDVEQIIPAIGQRVEPEGLGGLGRAGVIAADPWGRVTEGPGARSPIFTGGDARGDRGTVTEAIGDGRRAAKAIDDHLRERALPEFAPLEGLPYAALNTAYFDTAPRPVEVVAPPSKRGAKVEVDKGYPASVIAGEAGRCFSCGNCLACDNCWTLCPDGAVLKSAQQASDGSHYVFDYDFCKGCGICARECPSGYIAMHSELS